MRNVCLVALLSLLVVNSLTAQVFGFRRPNVWYVQPRPSLGIYLGHSGLDISSGTTVSDVFCWGAGLDLSFGANFNRFAFNNALRMEYEESHSTGQLPVKGPSLFEYAMRPVYNFMRDSASSVGVAFQGGVNTALTQETNTDGATTRNFFDPASLYEGLFLSADAGVGGAGELRMSFQLGYSLQQLVYRNPWEPPEGSYEQARVNTSGGGTTAFISIAYQQRAFPTGNQMQQILFFAELTLKGFRKEPDFKEIKNSRVEMSMRMGLNVLEFLEFVTKADVIYDSSISPRRELRTSISFNFKYNMDLSGRF